MVLKAPRFISSFDVSIFIYNFLFHFHSALLLFYAPLWGKTVLNTVSNYQSYTYIFVLLASSALTKPLGAMLLLFKKIRNNLFFAFQMTACLHLLSSALLFLSLTPTNFKVFYFLTAKLLQGVALGVENSLVRMIFSQNHEHYIQRITYYEMMCILSYMCGSTYLESENSIIYMISVYVLISIILCVHRFYLLQSQPFFILEKTQIIKSAKPEIVSLYQKMISIVYVAVLQFLYQISFFFPFVLCQVYASLIKIQWIVPLHEKLAITLLFLWDAVCLVIVARFVTYKSMSKVFYAGIFILIPCLYLYGNIDARTPYFYIYIIQMLTVLAGVCVMVPQMQWGFNALKGKVPHRLLPFSQGAIVHIASALWGRLLPLWAVFAIEKTKDLSQISHYALWAMLLSVFILILNERILKK
ncbi:MAG: hypothetical protein C0440_05870 [Candidatus Pelagibacter sp.]|nr:hypothetical protein [Candidatus Pelagibacter sp.]